MLIEQSAYRWCGSGCQDWRFLVLARQLSARYNDEISEHNFVNGEITPHDPQKVTLSMKGFETPMDDVVSTNSLKLEAAERILRLLQFLLANDCTRRDVFEHLGLYYRIDPVAPHQPISRSADKMFERDIRFLEDQGFEVQKTKNEHNLPSIVL